MFADIIHNQIFYVLISIQNKKSSIIIIQVMWTNCLHWEFGLTLKYLQSCFCFLWFVNFKSVRITLSVGNEMPQLVNCGLNFVVDITAKFPNSKSKKNIKKHTNKTLHAINYFDQYKSNVTEPIECAKPKSIPFVNQKVSFRVAFGVILHIFAISNKL